MYRLMYIITILHITIRHILEDLCQILKHFWLLLWLQIQQLELAEEEAVTKLHQLELEKAKLSTQLSELEAAHTDVKELEDIKHQLDLLRQTSHESQDQVKQLQVSID